MPRSPTGRFGAASPCRPAAGGDPDQPREFRRARRRSPIPLDAPVSSEVASTRPARLQCGVPTKVLGQTVKRNADRFPADFMFQLTPEEFANLRSQSVTSSWGGRRYPSYAFTDGPIGKTPGEETHNLMTVPQYGLCESVR
ncbi:MAG TPA: ORF6N domain-containing protein [Candidatus Methylomirabilis sp.]